MMITPFSQTRPAPVAQVVGQPVQLPALRAYPAQFGQGRPVNPTFQAGILLIAHQPLVISLGPGTVPALPGTERSVRGLGDKRGLADLTGAEIGARGRMFGLGHSAFRPAPLTFPRNLQPRIVSILCMPQRLIPNFFANCATVHPCSV